MGTNPYKPYKHACQAQRSGCKVSWRYYDVEAHAKEDAEIARHNGRVDADRGYDFGYQSPGAVSFIEAGKFAQAGENGRWELCVS